MHWSSVEETNSLPIDHFGSYQQHAAQYWIGISNVKGTLQLKPKWHICLYTIAKLLAYTAKLLFHQSPNLLDTETGLCCCSHHAAGS